MFVVVIFTCCIIYNGWGGGGYNLTAGFTPDSREYVQGKYTNTNFIEGMYLCNRYKMTPLNERYVLITIKLLTNPLGCGIIHNMNIGIDFYGTIDTAENQFKRLVQDANMAGNTVYIISAIAYNNTDRLRSDARRFLGVAQLIPVYVRNYMEHPWAKLRTCRELGIDLMIDNRADTCKLLKENGIDSIVYTSWKGFVQQYDAKTHSNEY